jgi:predicted AAA+ superfamily ATPase
MAKSIQAAFLPKLTENLELSSEFIQVILGPRQVGKTTGILNFLEGQRNAHLYFSADDVIAPDGTWLESVWQEARLKSPNCILAIDEIQRVPDWSSTVKKIWDRQKRAKESKIQLILLGSSSLQIHEGLKESLAGRFQLIRAHHWDFERSKKLASLDVETFVRCGGYPGSYGLIDRDENWQSYIRDSIVETVIGKDILQIARIAKPALFRQAFSILTSYPAQEISYTKLLGQLQDKGNTDLIRSYIELYEGAFLLKSVHKFSSKAVLTRTSSPKLIPLCGALISREVFDTSSGYGRAVEAAVGACLIQAELTLEYWREGNDEVDYVTKFERSLYAIEVKSGRLRTTKGMEKFLKQHPTAKPVYISEATLEAFLRDPRKYLAALS